MLVHVINREEETNNISVSCNKKHQAFYAQSSFISEKGTISIKPQLFRERSWGQEILKIIWHTFETAITTRSM